MGCIYRAGIYGDENCKNHFKIEGKVIFLKKKNDVAVNVAQRENNSIKCYALVYSNI